MFKLTHNCLTGFNETPRTVLPEIAKSWKISNVQEDLDLQSRDDVYFHNGEKMTADDWLFTIQYGKNASDGTVKGLL
jgi:ABC-type transport system substrate-binding protein